MSPECSKCDRQTRMFLSCWSLQPGKYVDKVLWCLCLSGKACNTSCVNKRGKSVFCGPLLHVPQPAGPASYWTWWKISLPVLTERYFGAIFLATQNLFLHASKLGVTCWGRLSKSVSNDRVQTFLTWGRMEQGFMFPNATPQAALLKNSDIFCRTTNTGLYLCVSGLQAFRIPLI